ncbi:MAG: HD domain-containing protein [bacterium]|nr:HD domain-containing protein [bacterium]
MEIAKEVLQIAEVLRQNGFKAYLVGGCLRDLLRKEEPQDWDLATDALPEKILELFPDSVYENDFGTVAIKTDSEDPKLKIIEVTTFRTEDGYSNKRHPDKVQFTKSIEEDLSRRDFSMNAIAFPIHDGDVLVDPFGGQRDLKNGLIRAVGDPDERFQEDALRLMRAVRFSAQLGFEIEKKTKRAIERNKDLLSHVSLERIKAELEKTIMSGHAAAGIENFRRMGLLEYIIPELLEGVNMEQNMHHIYSVYEHNLKSLDYSANKGYSLEVRLASLLHDVGKPATREWKDHPEGQKEMNGKKGDWTFYSHQVVGAKMTRKILKRLTFSKKLVDKVSLLVYEHMFVYDPDAVTLAGVRRLLARVGDENINDLIKVREADRIGSGVPKAQPYRLRHLMAMFEKVKTDPVSVKMLKINGDDLMKELKLKPGPKLGFILNVLLEGVLDDPKTNTEKELLKRAKDLAKFSEKELQASADAAKEKAKEAQDKIDQEIKAKYFVK